MNKKYTSYVILGVLAIATMLLFSAPTMADANGLIEVRSDPPGAKAFVKYGTDAGKYLGETPFYYDPTLNGGVTYITFVKPGYRNSTGVIFKYMTRLEYTIVYLNKI